MTATAQQDHDSVTGMALSDNAGAYGLSVRRGQELPRGVRWVTDTPSIVATGKHLVIRDIPDGVSLHLPKTTQAELERVLLTLARIAASGEMRVTLYDTRTPAGQLWPPNPLPALANYRVQPGSVERQDGGAGPWIRLESGEDQP